MKNEYGFDSEVFDRVCENALNGIDPNTLSDTEMQTHRNWVALNWHDLNTGVDESPFISTVDASTKLGISIRRVQQLINSGALRAKWIGRDWLINPDDLDKIPPPQKRGPKPKTPTN